MARVLHLAHHDVTFVPGRERHSGKLETYQRGRPTNAAGPAGLDHCLGLRASARSHLGGCRARG
jgi:hypothetical protein